MTVSFRNGFFVGLIFATIFALWLWQLWQPTRQVELHSGHLIAAVQSKNWEALGGFLDQSYRDQWNQDRPVVLSRLREVLRFARNLRITTTSAKTIATTAEGDWSARITIDAEENEIAEMIKSRVNNLDTPFELHWQHVSWKPWDWKLIRVTNSALELPAAGEF
ncbi:MAG: hypothetical protein JO201_00490 [Verrucomicrobia bacterium]|nr:hypothetical protein [Verrucomicrobiota bacterium]